MSEKLSFIVSPEWVKEKIESDSDLVLLDVPYGKKEYIDDNDPDKRRFIDQHLPGAVEINKEDFESKEYDLNLLSAEKLRDKFLELGIDKDTTVVVYSDGINASSRVAFIAYWLGVDNVYILNGGIHAWKESGYKLESGEAHPQVKENFGVDVPARPEILISTPDDVLEQQKNNEDFVLASVRSWEEFIGKTSGYPWIETAGEPLGAAYAKASKKRTDVSMLLSDDGKSGNVDEILANWEEWGITPDKQIAFYCGSGWRATIPFFFAKSLGWDNVQLYDGGWYQWNIYREKNPEKYKIQIGNPKENNLIIK